MSELPPRDLGAAAFAMANVAVETARIPLGALRHLPGMRLLTREGAAVQLRLRSRLEGVLADVLHAPEAERAIDALTAAFLASPAFDELVARVREAPSPDSGDAALPVRS
jgi:hypothetical protein